MSYTYAQQKRHGNKRPGAEPLGGGMMESSLPNSAMLETPGHQVDMPVVMREKMEESFGMDLSVVKLYENRAVGDAGAEAVAQGNKIAFAPGKLDFSSTKGQALLGHEISHVTSQARGEVKGSDLVNDSALEARADREGLMAARGESVTPCHGGAAAALSNASAASAAGPMQAKSGKKKKISDRARADYESAQLRSSNEEATEDQELDKAERDEKIDKLFRLTAMEIRDGLEYSHAINIKKQELLPKYLPDAERKGAENGWDKKRTNKHAGSLAQSEAIQLIKQNDFRTLSDDEYDWMTNMYDNADLDTLMEVSRRRNQLGEEIYKQHQDLVKQRPGEDEGKLKAETGYSPLATEYLVYDRILQSSRKNERLPELAQKSHSKLTPKQREIQKIVGNITATGVTARENNYLQTDEGMEVDNMLQKQQIEWLKELSGRK
ncbi:MAG: DUF4157 domain-containing protein [Anaerolineaceae bacterium]|nr:DUF4157 domain-containing protein [Anaerolineaceae bacterium]